MMFRFFAILIFAYLLNACSTYFPKDIPIGSVDIIDYRIPEKNNLTHFDSNSTQINKYNKLGDFENSEEQKDNLNKFELEDFNISPKRDFYYEYWQLATPLSIPGGHVIITSEVQKMLYDKTTPIKPILIDVRSNNKELITAKDAFWLNGLGYAYRSSIEDNTINSRMIRDLEILTQSDKNRMLIFMCANPICVLSYNASLRAIKLGYKKVYWYRGGIEAWVMAGLPLVLQKVSK